MNLNDTRSVDDYSSALLLDLSRRIEKSRTAEQLICRESELDEVWRLLDFAVVDAHRLGLPTNDVVRLERLRSAVIEVHDLVGVDNDVATAAARMKEIAREMRATVDVMSSVSP